MSDTVIRVENLGKKYVLDHHKEQRYTALRDVITNKAKDIGSHLNPFKPSASSLSSQEEFWALKNVSFEIKRGDRIGIIGQNGAGKSTLLKILSRITDPTSGVAELRGRVASLLEVGTGFHPELTGRENIFLNGAILGMGKKEILQKFDEIIDFAEIEKFLDTPVKRYSSGMYVRLAFAVAAHLEPEILVVDEVLAVGDVRFQKKCLGKMESVATEGRTIVFVSHNMAAINNLCQKGILLSHGTISAQGTSEEIVDKYLSLSNKSSIEYRCEKSIHVEGSPVRLLSAKISSGSGGREVDISKETVIEIVYENFKEDAQLYSSIHLKDSFGNKILASVNFPSGSMEKDDYACRKLDKGIYLARCTIPKDFLNDISYSVSILVLSHSMSVLAMYEDVLKFTAIDTGSMRGEFQGHWVGFVRPRLLWKTTTL